MARPLVINSDTIAALVKKGAKPITGKKLDFPTSAPAPWAKLPNGTILVAEERGELLVAV